MNFIKSVLSTIINLAIGPILRLKNARTMTVAEHAVNAVGIAARGTIVASFFTAVPAFLVKLSLLWVFGGFLIAGLMLGLGLLGFVSFLGFAAAEVKKNEQAAAANDQTIDMGAAQPA